MLNKNIAFYTGMFIFLLASTFTARGQAPDGIGQTIQIYTQLDAIVGKPQWLLIIRDIDNGQNIPYLFDIDTPNNFWAIFTYGHNYQISVSNLQFSPYRSNPYRSKKINNFCHLESRGRVMRGKSLTVRITGKLTANTNTFSCDILEYADTQFTVVHPGNN